MDPTFIVIGVCKGGTNSMIHHFNLHEEIFMSRNEAHFFDDNKVSNSRTLLREVST